MVTEKPLVGIPVHNIEASASFYRDVLGFTVEPGDRPGTALVEAAGRRYLLASSGIEDISQCLAENHSVLKSGDVLYVSDPELAARRARLASDGTVTPRDLARPWGDHGFELRDPDGYRVQLWAIIERSPREALALYRRGRDDLRSSITGLSESDLDLSLRDGGWTIREIVHHLADSEVTVLAAARVALAEPGKEYLSNPYDQGLWAESLRYAHRDVGPSLRLFEAIRDQVVQLVETVPDAWNRSIRTKHGWETAVGAFVLMLSTHALEHIEEIREIRAANGVTPAFNT